MRCPDCDRKFDHYDPGTAKHQEIRCECGADLQWDVTSERVDFVGRNPFIGTGAKACACERRRDDAKTPLFE